MAHDLVRSSTVSSTTRFFFASFFDTTLPTIWEKFSTIFPYQLLQGTVVAQSGTVGQDAKFIPFAWKTWKKEVEQKQVPLGFVILGWIFLNLQTPYHGELRFI